MVERNRGLSTPKKNKERKLQPTLQRCPYHRRRVGFLKMTEYDVTKLPFTSISRENWQMLVELPAEELYEVIQVIGHYVLTGEECNCETVLSKIVCNQIVSVIDRKGQKYCNTTGNLKPRQKKEEKQEEPQEHDDDYYFDSFLEDPQMDFSYLLGDITYFKNRKADDLNRLYVRLGKRYTGDQIIQILQEKYMKKLNNQNN